MRPVRTTWVIGDFSAFKNATTSATPVNDTEWVEVDRLTRMLFHFTEFPPKSSPGGMAPTLTTYYDLRFALHPPADEVEP